MMMAMETMMINRCCARPCISAFILHGNIENPGQVVHIGLDVLRLLPQVWRELQAGHTSSVVANEEHRELRIECQLGELRLPNNLLLAHGLVPVLIEVVHKYLPVGGGRGEYRAASSSQS